MFYFCTNLSSLMIRVANLLEFESADRITVGPDGLTDRALNALATGPTRSSTRCTRASSTTSCRASKPRACACSR